jgi:hypothetical protein
VFRGLKPRARGGNNTQGPLPPPPPPTPHHLVQQEQGCHRNTAPVSGSPDIGMHLQPPAILPALRWSQLAQVRPHPYAHNTCLTSIGGASATCRRFSCGDTQHAALLAHACHMGVCVLLLCVHIQKQQCATRGQHAGHVTGHGVVLLSGHVQLEPSSGSNAAAAERPPSQ